MALLPLSIKRPLSLPGIEYPIAMLVQNSKADVRGKLHLTAEENHQLALLFEMSVSHLKAQGKEKLTAGLLECLAAFPGDEDTRAAVEFIVGVLMAMKSPRVQPTERGVK